jgi:hypothetical protein
MNRLFNENQGSETGKENLTAGGSGEALEVFRRGIYYNTISYQSLRRCPKMLEYSLSDRRELSNSQLAAISDEKFAVRVDMFRLGATPLLHARPGGNFLRSLRSNWLGRSSNQSVKRMSKGPTVMANNSQVARETGGKYGNICLQVALLFLGSSLFPEIAIELWKKYVMW